MHGTAIGTKVAIAFANIFMAKIEQTILRQNTKKPLGWKRPNDDIFCCGTQTIKIENFSLSRSMLTTLLSSLILEYRKYKLHS